MTLLILKKVFSNPFTWIALLIAGAFFYGLRTGHVKVEQQQLKQENEIIKEVVVKHDKIHRKYDAIKSDTIIDIERLLSYRTLTAETFPTDLRGSEGQ